MKHLRLFFLATLSAAASVAFAGEPKVTAQSAILIDSKTGQVLFEKNADEKRPMASTTKMMTAILLVENCRKDEIITAGKDVEQIPSSSLHLKPGEKVSAEDMLKAILLRSANDACLAVAEHIAGTEEKFVEMMNKRAREMGALNTSFANPHGLSAPNHYSTARDLAIIGKKAIEYPRINEIISLRRARISRSMNQEDVTMNNHSRFLRSYQGADGIKTGFTKDAGQCLVASATRNGWRLISVVLKSENNACDSCALMDYGFNNFEREILAKKGEHVEKVRVKYGKKREIDAVSKDDLYVVVRKGFKPKVERRVELAKLTAPVEKNKECGEVMAVAEGRIVDKAMLVTSEAVDRSIAAVIWSWFKAGILAAALGFVGFITYGTAVAKNSRRRRRRFKASLRRFDNLG